MYISCLVKPSFRWGITPRCNSDAQPVLPRAAHVAPPASAKDRDPDMVKPRSRGLKSSQGVVWPLINLLLVQQPTVMTEVTGSGSSSRPEVITYGPSLCDLCMDSP